MPTSMASPPAVVTSSACDGRAATGRAFGVVPDQQERQDRRQFPEHVQQQHVVAGDEAEHGAGEGHHLGGEDAAEAGSSSVK